MVAFLLDNSLGAWWASRRLTDSDLAAAGNEEELRAKAALPDVPLDYLRFVRDGEGPWTAAAGTFERWPDNLADFRLLDPCCGSGHFLVAAFRMLVPMRMEAEGLTAREAVDAVLRDNVHGLELDRRCVELAAFALAMDAWTYPGAGGYRELPELNVACSGTAVGANRVAWTELAGRDARMETVLGNLYDAFKEAPVLGSLIDPEASAGGKGLYKAEWADVRPLLDKALSAEDSVKLAETVVAAKGIAEAATLLARRYTLVITNVPYLSGGKHSETLKNYCKDRYPEAKGDLATVFLDRCLKLCQDGWSVAAVTPQNWLSLTSYTKFRVRLLKEDAWQIFVRLGPGAFETISGEVVKAVLVVISQGFKDRNNISCIDVSGQRSVADKSKALAASDIVSIGQAGQLGNPDARVSAEELGSGELLETTACCLDGLQTGDNPRMRLYFWEVGTPDMYWSPFCGTVNGTIHFGGMSYVLRWEGGHGAIDAIPGARKQGIDAWKKRGVIVSQMGGLPVSLYSGQPFEHNTAVILPDNPEILPALWCYCSSPEYNHAVRAIDKALKVTNATLVKVPFDIECWTQAANERYPHRLPAPYSDDPTQWIFHGHPCGSVVWDDDAKRVAYGPLRTDANVLHIAVARLLGYRWPAELDAEMELADEQRELVSRCESLSEFIDRDGIVAIPAVKGETAAVDRILDILIASYGKEWSNKIVSRLLANSDHTGGSLESWLRDKFFSQHCILFQNRPFIWQIWDGLRDGFSALVNSHKLGRHLLESLTFAYLGDWLVRQRHAQKNKVEGAERRIVAAEALQQRLQAIIEGEAPYDIFVRWKPLAEQPVGWNPDINDGVRLNIRPFMMPPDVGKKGAGILRYKPNVRWDKDRGKDAESAPWYHIDRGERINDRHLKLSEKDKSRS
jgi:hypothetical protein